MSRGWSDHRLAQRPGRDEWSAVEVLAHLRACVEIWGGNIEALVEGEHARLRTTDPRDWLEGVDLVSQGFASSLRSFRRQRARLLLQLEGLSLTDWTATVTVLTWGQRYPRSVLYYADRLARHERSHLRQIERLTIGSSGPA